MRHQVLENPGWYTAYTPYQAEISQGRLESLLNFQTMVTDLTGLPLANASLLDEATAAAEAMAMCYSLKNQKKKKFFVDERCHPQNIALAQTRGGAMGMTIIVGNVEKDLDMSGHDFCGVMVQYPDTYGSLIIQTSWFVNCAIEMVVCLRCGCAHRCYVGTLRDWSEFAAQVHEHDALVVGCTDLLASTLLKPVGEMGFDIAVGSAQRFGVPMGFGGPHAGFLATTST